MDDKIETGAFSITLASRRSALAMVQARHVVGLLADQTIDILGLSTTGDEVLDRPLVEVGGKGVFIKALEAAMLDGRADAAVHSMKDMETILAPGTRLVAVLSREDRRDALIGAARLSDLPEGAHIGTSSVRRAAWLHHYRPDLKIGLLRGNVGSRLEKWRSGQFDAILLAMAGLKRLGLDTDESLAISPLSEQDMPPAAAQGALAIQCRTGTERAASVEPIFAALNDEAALMEVTAERAMLAHLDGSCRTPISASAHFEAATNSLHLYGAVLSADGRQKFDAEMLRVIDDGLSGAAQLGTALGADLLAQCGGHGFLA